MSTDELKRVSYKSVIGNIERDAFVYLPTGYYDNPNEEWPVLLFLHGDGERGNGKEELPYTLKHGPLYEAWVLRKALPFIIIAPQLHLFGRDKIGLDYLTDRKLENFPNRIQGKTPKRIGFDETTEAMRGAENLEVFNGELAPNGWDKVDVDLINILDKVVDGYKVDKKKVYVSGLSYGGFGTWHLISKFPKKFAAAVPVVAWPNPPLTESIAKSKIPIWAFSGGRDGVIRKKYFLEGLNKLEALGHKVNYTIHEDLGHDTWKRVYAGKDIYDWLLEHEL